MRSTLKWRNCLLYLSLVLFLLLPHYRLLAEEVVPNAKPSVSGYIKDAANGETLIGATVFIKGTTIGTSSNVYGFYSLSLSPGAYTLVISYIGYTPIEKEITLNDNVALNVELTEESTQLEAVVITSEAPNANVTKAEMSVQKLETKTIQRIPALMGEVDVIKAIQMLPGVINAAEGSSGFSVRGGGIDQNLILLDEATVYNASHMMGFFSVFNNDAVKDVKLYKGDVPASAGGRLSSLLDVRMREGNSKTFAATGGIGTISSRLTVEGPIIKDRTSFLVSGRRTYADIFLPLASNEDVRDNTLYFYDLNLKVNHRFNDNNRLFISGYFGRDKFGSDFSTFQFGNQTLTMRWNHVFGKKLFLNTTLIHSRYNYALGTAPGEASSFEWESDLIDNSIKLDFGYYINHKNTFKFGAQTIHHKFNPGIAQGTGEESLFNKFELPSGYALEHGIYALNEQQVGDKLTLKYGIRFSIFQNLGEATVYQYNDSYESTGTVEYEKNDVFNTYSTLEPRFGAVWAFSPKNSVKASYSRTAQYVQQATNSQAGTPLDIWFPASPNVKPQISDQAAVGYFHNFLNNTIETSVEVYYKEMRNVIDFKDFANLILNKELEGEIRVGEATAFGAELFAKVNLKKVNGWVSYTFSKSERTIADVNNGKTYAAPFDKPHNISIVLNYDLNQRVSLSANWLFASGVPTTYPTGRVEIMGTIIPIFSERNKYRYPNYHRLDIGVNIKGKQKPNRRWQGEWNISVYNAYGRKNAWAINFIQDEENPTVTKAEKTYLFSIIPSVTYNFKF